MEHQNGVVIQERLFKVIISGFSLVAELGDPHELYVLLYNSCPPPSIFVDHEKNVFGYFFNLCMTKANLTSMTSLRMETLLSY